MCLYLTIVLMSYKFLAVFYFFTNMTSIPDDMNLPNCKEKSHMPSPGFFLEAWIKFYSKTNSHSKSDGVGSRKNGKSGHKIMLKT